MGRQLTTTEFITKANLINGELYDYTKTTYTGSHTKVCIIDPRHGEFWQDPTSHLRGHGNAQRAINQVNKEKRLTLENFIIRSNSTHNNRYDYTKVVYKNVRTPVCIIDPEHGEFYQKPMDHLQGSGCPNRVCNGSDSIHRDHIIPLAILGAYKTLNRKRPLYKFLNSETNIQYISGSTNNEKSDWIEYKGEKIRARDVSNNYKIIAHLSETLLSTNIDSIILKDKILDN